MSSDKDRCPVNHDSNSETAKIWSAIGAHSSPNGTSLSQTRETSSIPRHQPDSNSNSSNWVYPSEAQFFAAMERKQHNPVAADMKTVVPIHNSVNERAWSLVREWEQGRGGEACGGIRLVSFKGKPSEPSIRARWNSLIGYSPPFDRHDWIVDRCGQRIRYIIDFYSGKNNMSFYIDARPALDNFEGFKMRFDRFWSKWLPQKEPVK